MPDTGCEAPSRARVGLTLAVVGLTAFGGPAAHVALMRRLVVERRRWVPAEAFNRMFAACNLIPGPSSTELAMFVGWRLGGGVGLAIAAAAFIAPAMVIMLGLAAVYEQYGRTTTALALLHGVRPVVVAIIAWAALDLLRKVVGRPFAIAAVPVACALSLAGVNPVLVLAVAAAVGAAAAAARGRWLSAAILLDAHPERLAVLLLAFLKIGAVAFGSGYVLFAFLDADFVAGLHWLQPQQLADAVALGQVTPGPVFTTATFLGFLFAGVPGALLATVAIFLPGLALVPLLDRVVRLADTRPSVRLLLDAVNAAVVGLILAVGWTLARTSIGDAATLVIAAVAFPILAWRPLAAPALVAGGALVGLLLGA